MSQILEKINASIADNQTEKAIQFLLEKVSPDTETYQTVLLRSGDFQKLKKDQLNGLLGGEEFSRRLNQINLAILEIAKNLEEKNTTKTAPTPSTFKKETVPPSKINWKWVSGGMVLGALIIFFIFQNGLDTNPEYLWSRIPDSKDFSLTRLDPETNSYLPVGKNTTSHFVGDDVIAYDPSSHQTVVLRNYKTQNNKEIPAEVLKPESVAYWKKSPDLRRFFLFDKGTRITEFVSDQLEEDLLVYSAANNSTYFIENFVTNKDVQFHPAQKLSPPSRAYWRGIWQSNLFDLYDRGKNIAGSSKSYFEGNDLVVIHPTEDIRFRLKNYKELQDDTFRAAIVEE